MERIEVPAEVYFKAQDGKKFRLQEDCEKWESLYPKWTNPVRYREFEGEEGKLCYAFWVETKEDITDVLWFFNHKLHACARSYTGLLRDEPQWLVIRPFYDGYNADFEVMPIAEYRELLDEAFRAVNDAIGAVVKLIFEKA